MDDATFINLLLVFVLVCITGYYAWQTRQMAIEMKSARQYEFTPFLKVIPARLTLGDSLDIRLTNIGFGPAKNIRGKIMLQPADKDLEFAFPYLSPKDERFFRDPFKLEGNAKSLSDDSRVTLKVTFEDVMNKPASSEDSFVIGDIELMDKAYPSRVEAAEVVRRLADIERAIKGLSKR
jgi:hypothetical protein